MPYKDPEIQRTYNSDYKRRKRAEFKEQGLTHTGKPFVQRLIIPKSPRKRKKDVKTDSV